MIETQIIEDNLYLVTGGSGFLGDKLIERLLEKKARVRVLARNEGNLMKLKQKYPSIEIYPGDVTDRFSVHQAAEGTNGCFHLAAFKHVGMAEEFSLECINSNVIGTLNILGESQITCWDFVLGISTDKAAQVNGTYGASKFLMESMFHQYERIGGLYTAHRLVRYGNVLYSTGSVLCKWKDLIEKGQQCTITDPDATRFYWTVDQAIDLIFDCLDKAKDSTPYCPSMRAMRIIDLLTAMQHKYGKGGFDLSPKIIGLQKGENKHERLIEGGPMSNEVKLYTIPEIVELI